jgi:hypothetical protein
MIFALETRGVILQRYLDGDPATIAKAKAMFEWFESEVRKHPSSVKRSFTYSIHSEDVFRATNLKTYVPTTRYHGISTFDDKDTYAIRFRKHRNDGDVRFYFQKILYV